jgi:hypothetical protein
MTMIGYVVKELEMHYEMEKAGIKTGYTRRYSRMAALHTCNDKVGRYLILARQRAPVDKVISVSCQVFYVGMLKDVF